jgi:RNA polymerase sigma-70 factor (ECF subfamily)
VKEQVDSQLVGLAQAGDAEAYGQLFERYQSKIYNFAYSILGHAEDARDVTQDAFIRVFEALPGKQDLDFSPYVYRTARNLAYDVARTRGRFIGDSGTTLDAQVADGLDADPESASLFSEQQAKVRAAITALPTDYRAILTLREIDEMSYQEIADSLGMPRNTVGVMISRARLKFRGAFRMQYVDANKLAEECKDMLPKLSAYIDGELKQAEVIQVDEHLDGCPLCRLAVDQMREASKSYRAFIPLIPPIALKADVFSRFLHTPGSSGTGGVGQQAGGEGQAAQGGESPVGGQGGGTDAGSTADGSGRQGGPSAGDPAADGRGGGADSAEGASRSSQSVKSLTLKKALKSPALWVLLGLTALLLVAGGVGIATGWGTGTVAPTSESPTAPAITAVAPASFIAASEATVAAPSMVASAAIVPTDVAVAEAAVKDVEAPQTPARKSPSNGVLVSSDHVTLRWHSVTDPSGVRYGVEVQQWIGGGEGWHGLSVKTLDAQHHHTDVPIKIRWRVWAVDGAGNRSAKSSWWIVVRAADEPDEPAAPSADPTWSVPPITVPYAPDVPLR